MGNSNSTNTSVLVLGVGSLSFGLGYLVKQYVYNSCGKPKCTPFLLRDCQKSSPSKPCGDIGKKPGFLKLFQQLVEEVQEDMRMYGMPEDTTAHMRRVMEYNIPGGKLNRGLTVVHVAQRILGAENISMAELRRIGVLGWCIEWIQASFLVADDLMDSSITRRGQPCWYRNKEIGMIAVNDALILLTHFEILLRRYYGDSDIFLPLHSVLTETVYQTELGQTLDLTTQPPQDTKVNLELFTESRYNLIVKYKTAFYSFYAPIALGMIASGIFDKESLDLARSICIKMGTYFQIQDDYLDCYGDPGTIGKIGTDIQDKKCSWLVVQALNIASEEQKKVIRENYGTDDQACINKVKQVYKELNLEGIFKEYEEKSYKELVEEIKTVQKVPPAVFLDLLHKIYKRQK
mmetsp:Transcript_1445/g.1857  ORF Transcript_1445/g.1857 Transcript_1445/m.1857 type:complete len:404 (-) Transcript_1445:925-2136(-)